MKTQSNVELAAVEYRERKAGSRQPRASYNDKLGHWELLDDELQSCCMSHLPGQRMHHARSALHVAALFGVTTGEMLQAYYQLRNRFNPQAQQDGERP